MFSSKYLFGTLVEFVNRLSAPTGNTVFIGARGFRVDVGNFISFDTTNLLGLPRRKHMFFNIMCFRFAKSMQKLSARNALIGLISKS